MNKTDAQGSEKDQATRPGSENTDTPAEAGEKTGTPDLKVRIPLKAAAREVEAEIEAVAAKYQKDIKLPGFRKGAVPLDLIKQRYQDGIREEALQQVINRKLAETIQERKIHVATQPVVEDISYQQGRDLEASVVLERLPDVAVPDLGKLEARIERKELQAESYDEKGQIDKVLEGHKYREPVKGRAIQKGDILKLKIQSTFLDTRRKTPVKEETVTLDNKAETDIMDLTQELVGKKKGAQLVFKRTYPADYKRKAWAGKEMEHAVEILDAHFMKKPEFNQQFIKSLGFESEQQFTRQLKTEYEEHARKQREDKIVSRIIETLTEASDFEVPESLVVQEMNRLNPYGEAVLKHLDEDKRKEFLDHLRSNAVNNVKFSLLYEAIRDGHSLSVSQQDIEKEYRTIASQHNVSLAEVRKYYSQPEQKEKLHEALERNRVIEFLKDNITVKEV